MTRRHFKWKPALALLAGFTAITVTASTGGPITVTEANWTDEVNVSASLTADPNAGANHARSLTSEGYLVPIFSSNSNPTVLPMNGTASYATNTAGLTEQREESGPIDVETDAEEEPRFQSRSSGCARTNPNPVDCEGEPGGLLSAAAAVADLDSFSAMTLRSTTLAEYENENPIRATATCTPNADGAASVTAGGDIILNGLTSLSDRRLTIQTSSGTDTTTQRSHVFWTYSGTVTTKIITGPNYALADVRLKVESTALLGLIPSWQFEVVLARAECSLSSPGLDDPEIPVYGQATGGRGTTMNAVMDEALAAEQPETENEESEAGTLDEAAAEVERDGATTTATSSSRSPEAAPSETADAETSTSTSPSTSIPEITRQTTTVTSSPSDSPNPSTTRTSTSTTVTSSGPRGSTKPASTTPPTSTQPAVAIPTEPVNLPEPARTADAATVEVSGEDLDVVVRGATAPTDARTGARVLGNWINDDSSSTGDWKPFTSDDPDEDGWRWAAINQKTGTVVYIR